MLEQFQFTLDFDSETSSDSVQYVFSVQNPELGIGKVLESNPVLISVYFESYDQTSTHSKDELIFLDKYPEALFQPETRKGEAYLSLLAYELKLAHSYDKLTSLSNSRTRLLPHQIESTYIVMNSLKPRFILADEVGLGKTIEAALIMKELIFRKNFKRILIVVPSPLQYQWQQELKTKFNEDFSIIKKNNFTKNDETNWQNYNKIITSIDFIKNEYYSEQILKKKWDIVIFDEAHRLRRDYSKVTNAYAFAEKISKKCEALLLLTATPFRGKLEELFYLVQLVDSNLFGNYHSFMNDYIVGNKQDLKEKISKILLRRRKVEVGGFTKRFAKTVRIELSEAERMFYDETTEYVKREYNIAMNSENRAVGFIMIVFQKLLDSSVIALLKTLVRRKFVLENRLHQFTRSNPGFDFGDPDETEEIEDFVSEIDSKTNIDLQNIKKEILILNRLIYLGKAIKEDRKSLKLKETINKLKKEGFSKFIIFTQFRTTQEYLANILNEYKVSLFHGSLNALDKEKAIEEFKKETDILICTEAGGEGRNLQFTNILFNYDLPWSPLKIEQRIGRIHRFGQKDNVYIFNFASKDTVAERILEVLNNKIKLFEDSIGASDALLGTIEEEVDFHSTLMKFVTGKKTKQELEEEIEIRIKLAEKGFTKLNSLVAPKMIDFNLQDYYDHTLEKREYDNTHLEDFILSFSKVFPERLEQSFSKASEKTYRMYQNNEIKKVTFDSETALKDESIEFLAFGHPIVDNAVNYLLENHKGFYKKYMDHIELNNQILFIFLVEFDFRLKRTELIYMKYNSIDSTIVEETEMPEYTHDRYSFRPDSSDPSYEERAFIETYQYLLNIVQDRREKLQESTLSIFKKEEYKIELSGQKHIRQLEEKLSRQEAQLKWEPRPEKRSALNRTKNEILKAKEEYHKQIRILNHEKIIHYKIALFQMYIGQKKSNSVS